MRRTRIRPQNPCVLSICDERAFVPKTLAFLIYAPPRECAAARAAPLILRLKTRAFYVYATNAIRPENPCVFSICAAPPVCRRARRAPDLRPKTVRFEYMRRPASAPPRAPRP